MNEPQRHIRSAAAGAVVAQGVGVSPARITKAWGVRNGSLFNILAARDPERPEPLGPICGPFVRVIGTVVPAQIDGAITQIPNGKDPALGCDMLCNSLGLRK